MSRGWTHDICAIGWLVDWLMLLEFGVSFDHSCHTRFDIQLYSFRCTMLKSQDFISHLVQSWEVEDEVSANVLRLDFERLDDVTPCLDSLERIDTEAEKIGVIVEALAFLEQDSLREFLAKEFKQIIFRKHESSRLLIGIRGFNLAREVPVESSANDSAFISLTELYVARQHFDHLPR